VTAQGDHVILHILDKMISKSSMMYNSYIAWFILWKLIVCFQAVWFTPDIAFYYLCFMCSLVLSCFFFGPLMFHIWILLTFFYIACRMCWIDLRAGKETWVDVWHTREHLYNHHYLDEWAQRHILSKLRLLNYLVCMGDLLIVRWREQLKLQKFCLWIFFPWSLFSKIQSLLIFSIFIHLVNSWWS